MNLFLSLLVTHNDALLYPSANTKGEGMNIVLTKDYVDKINFFVT